MPVGFPKDPEKHAAVMAAKKAEREANGNPKRTYKPRKTSAAAQSTTKRKYVRRTPVVNNVRVDPDDLRNIDPRNMMKVADENEETIQNLEEQLNIALDRAHVAERRLMALLDLMSKI